MALRDLPPNLKPTDPDFIRQLNDRLRRLDEARIVASRRIQSVEDTSAGDGTTPTDAIPPGPVTIVSGYSRYDANGALELVVKYQAPSPKGTWVGPHAWVETEDQGTAANVFELDGNSPLDGTQQLSGEWAPVDYGKLPDDPDGLLVLGGLKAAPRANYPIRVYLGSWSEQMDLPLVRFGETGATPSIVITAQPPTAEGALGEEYCSNPVGLEVIPSEVPGGVKRTRLTLNWTRPAYRPPRGAWVYIQWEGMERHPLGIVVASGQSVELDTPTALVRATVFAPGFIDYAETSAIEDDLVNGIVLGITPRVEITIGSSTGVVDARQFLAESIAAHLGVTSGVFGVKPNAITEALVANYAFSQISLADGAAITRVLGDLAVDTSKLADLAATAAKLANGAVIEPKIFDGAVGTLKLASLAVTEAKLGTAAVTQIKIANAAVGSAAIANLAVGSAAIDNAAVTNLKLDRASANKIAIVNADIVSLAAAKITTGTLAFDVAYGGTINVNQINVGFLDGFSFRYTLNGIRVELRALFEGGDLSEYVGLKTTKTATGEFSAVTGTSLQFLSATGAYRAGIGNDGDGWMSVKGGSGLDTGKWIIYAQAGSDSFSNDNLFEVVDHNFSRKVTIRSTHLEVNDLGASYGKLTATALQFNNQQVVRGRVTGWTRSTGTPKRNGFDTATATLTDVAETLKALIDDLHADSGTSKHNLLAA